MTGISRRQIFNYLAGNSFPRNSTHRHAVAACLLDLKTGNDHDDSILVAHGHKPTLANMKKMDGHEAWESSRRWEQCAGCKRWRQTNQRRYD